MWNTATWYMNEDIVTHARLNHPQRSDSNAQCPPESLLAPCSHLYTLLLYGYLYYTAVTSLFSSALPLVSIPQCSALIREQSEQKPSWAAAIQQLSPLPLWHCRLPFSPPCFFHPHGPTSCKFPVVSYAKSMHSAECLVSDIYLWNTVIEQSVFSPES